MCGMNQFAMKGALFVAIASLVASAANAETAADKIARAMTAAPTNISEQATFRDLDGTLLQEGTNGWVCFPTTPTRCATTPSGWPGWPRYRPAESFPLT